MGDCSWTEREENGEQRAVEPASKTACARPANPALMHVFHAHLHIAAHDRLYVLGLAHCQANVSR